MKIVARYSFNNGLDSVQTHYMAAYNDIIEAINDVDAELCRIKDSKEKTMRGKLLYSPSCFNKCFKSTLGAKGWYPYKVKCEYKYGELLEGYQQSEIHGAYREMDFLKKPLKLGIEVQFGKYAFMVYNVCGKMTIFRNLGIIDTGIEIVPVKALADEMSTGVSYFEQFAWDMEHRGVCEVDVPVLILGINA